MRYDRMAATYLGFLQLGCVMILMRKVSDEFCRIQ
jgi:hypothetical protein